MTGVDVARRVSIVVAVVAALVVLPGPGPLGSAPASAAWSYNGGPTNIDITEAPGMPGHTCNDRVAGRVGASVPGAPDEVVIPPPYGTRVLEVYVSAHSFEGATAVPGGLKLADTDEIVPAFRTILSPVLAALSPLETFLGGGIHTVYAAAPFYFPLPPGALEPGEYFAVKVESSNTFASGRAAQCDPGGTPPRW